MANIQTIIAEIKDAADNAEWEYTELLDRYDELQNDYDILEKEAEDLEQYKELYEELLAAQGE